MGAISAGLGCGTTVYFELPLFCAAMAGKEPLLPAAAVQPLPPPPPSSGILSGTLMDSVVSSDVDGGPASTPQRTKPRPPSSPPLTGSAIVVVDADDADSDGDPDAASPSPAVRREPRPGWS